MSETFLDTKNIKVKRDVLPQLTGAADSVVTDVMKAVDSEVTLPFALRVSGSYTLTVGAAIIVNPYTSVQRSVSPIGTGVPYDFSGGTIVVPSTNGDNITSDTGGPALAVNIPTDGHYIRIGIGINSLGQIQFASGVSNANPNLATTPIVSGYSIGEVLLQRSGASIVAPTTASLYQYGGVGTDGGSSGVSEFAANIETTEDVLTGQAIRLINSSGPKIALATSSAHPYYGIVQEDALTGETPSIVIAGGVSVVHSGLTVGAEYYVQPDSTLSTTQVGEPIGIAISTTAIRLYSRPINDTVLTTLTVEDLSVSLPIETNGSKKLVSGTQTGTGAFVKQTSPTINSPTLTGTPSGAGIVPVGAMIPIAANLTGSYAIPGSGVVDGNGWMLCDGAAIPGGQTLSGNTPNLTDDRFLMGGATAGVTGGANSQSVTSGGSTAEWASSTLALSGSQSIAHTHDLSNHTHNIAHAHVFASTNASANLLSRASLDDSATTSGSNLLAQKVTIQSGSGDLAIDTPFANSNYYTSGVLSPPNGSDGATASSGTPSNNSSGGMSANSTVSGSNFNFNKSSLNTDQNTHTHSVSIPDSRPKFLSARYLIRVR